MNMYRVHDGDLVIAIDEEQAKALWLEDRGATEGEFRNLEVKLLPDDRKVQIWLAVGSGSTIKTARQWANDESEPCVFACVEWNDEGA